MATKSRSWALLLGVGAHPEGANSGKHCGLTDLPLLTGIMSLIAISVVLIVVQRLQIMSLVTIPVVLIFLQRLLLEGCLM